LQLQKGVVAAGEQVGVAQAGELGSPVFEFGRKLHG
jgi:hypothetical protein